MNITFIITLAFAILLFLSLPSFVFHSLSLSIPIFYLYIFSGAISIYFFHYFYILNYLKYKKQELNSFIIKADIERDKEIYKKQLEVLEDLVSKDALTSLWNKTYCLDRVQQEYKRAQRNNNHLSILYIDIDHFKKINESYGEDFGNNYLISLSHLLISTVRNSDIICRYQSDEFIIILPDTPHLGALAVAEKICHNIRNLYLSPNLQISVSIGICSHGVLHKNWLNIISCAKNALIQAKKEGRNKIIYST